MRSDRRPLAQVRRAVVAAAHARAAGVERALHVGARPTGLLHSATSSLACEWGVSDFHHSLDYVHFSLSDCISLDILCT